MRKILIPLLLLIGSFVQGQALVVPANPDTVIVPISFSSTVRTARMADLLKNIYAKVKADSTTLAAAIPTVTGTNTGDETTSSIKSKLGITTLSGSNTGDQDLSGYATTSALSSGLAGKANTSHTHAESDVTNLVSDLSGKLGTATSIVINGVTIGLNGTTTTLPMLGYTTFTGTTPSQLQTLINSGVTKIFIPAGTYTFNSKVTLPTGTDLRGAGNDKTIFQVTTWAGLSSEGIFMTNGASDITIRDISVTGNASYTPYAFRFNAFPTSGTNHRYRIEGVRIYSFWGEGISFNGSVAVNMNDDIWIQNCMFQKIYDPAHRTSDYQGNNAYHAINLNTGAKKIFIANNVADSISGNFIFSFGWATDGSQPLADFNYAETIISQNLVNNMRMGVEYTSGYQSGQRSIISNNVMAYPTVQTLGYCISVTAPNSVITGNTFISTEREILEILSRKTLVTGNNLYFSVFKTGVGGDGLVGFNNDSIKYALINCAGFDVKISGNNMYLDTRYADGSITAAHMSGIKPTGTGVAGAYWEAHPTHEGITDTAAFFDVSDNFIQGYNQAALEASNNLIRNAYIHGNTFASRNTTTGSIWVHGYNWRIQNNIFDLTGSTSAGDDVVKYHNQSDSTKSTVSFNHIINDTWKLTTNYGAYNHYLNYFTQVPSGVTYLVNPEPRMSQANRLAIASPRDGTLVYQTDGTYPGPWRYDGNLLGGGWQIDMPATLPGFATTGTINISNNNGINFKQSGGANKIGILASTGNKVQIYSLGSGIEFWNNAQSASYSNMTDGGLWNFGTNASPTSTMSINGSFQLPTIDKGVNYTLTVSDYKVRLTATSLTATLPSASGTAGRIYVIKLTASGTGTVATTSSQTIDGSTTYSLSAQYKYVTVQSNGSNWDIIANN